MGEETKKNIFKQNLEKDITSSLKDLKEDNFIVFSSIKEMFKKMSIKQIHI